ncbi:hypothetical protein WN48_03362, partial [Eufriesea mexicana]
SSSPHMDNAVTEIFVFLSSIIAALDQFELLHFIQLCEGILFKLTVLFPQSPHLKNLFTASIIRNRCFCSLHISEAENDVYLHVKHLTALQVLNIFSSILSFISSLLKYLFFPSRRVPCPLTPSSYLVRDPHPCVPPTHLPRPSGPRATPPRPTPAPTAIRPRARTRLERRARSQLHTHSTYSSDCLVLSLALSLSYFLFALVYPDALAARDRCSESNGSSTALIHTYIYVRARAWERKGKEGKVEKEEGGETPEFLARKGLFPVIRPGKGSEGKQRLEAFEWFEDLLRLWQASQLVCLRRNIWIGYPDSRDEISAIKTEYKVPCNSETIYGSFEFIALLPVARRRRVAAINSGELRGIIRRKTSMAGINEALMTRKGTRDNTSALGLRHWKPEAPLEPSVISKVHPQVQGSVPSRFSMRATDISQNSRASEDSQNCHDVVSFVNTFTTKSLESYIVTGSCLTMIGDGRFFELFKYERSIDSVSFLDVYHGLEENSTVFSMWKISLGLIGHNLSGAVAGCVKISGPETLRNENGRNWERTRSLQVKQPTTPLRATRARAASWQLLKPRSRKALVYPDQTPSVSVCPTARGPLSLIHNYRARPGHEPSSKDTKGKLLARCAHLVRERPADGRQAEGALSALQSIRGESLSISYFVATVASLCMSFVERVLPPAEQMHVNIRGIEGRDEWLLSFRSCKQAAALGKINFPFHSAEWMEQGALLRDGFMGIESEEGCARLMRNNEFPGKQESAI